MPRFQPHPDRLAGYLFAALCAVLAACGGDPASPEVPEPRNVAVESSNRETGTIGPAGGVISTTSSAGITYTLEIPPGAFAGDVAVAITPITAVRNLPFDGRLEGGVQLQPSGTKLLKPAVLMIGRAPSTGDDERLVGFSYEGDAKSYEPSSATEDGSSIRVLVSHFSGAGAASGGSQGTGAWLAALCASVPTLDYPVYSQIDACWSPPEPKRDWFIRTSRDYIEDIVTPIVQGAGDLSLGVVEYIEWYTTCDELAPAYDAPDWATVLEADLIAIQELLTQRLIDEVAAEKATMCLQGGVEHLRLVLEYKHLADLAGFGGEPGLRQEDILQGLCATVDIAELTLPRNMTVGTDHSLDMRAELLVNAQREDGLFNVFVLVADGTCAGAADCSGRTNGLGEYTAVIRRTGPEPVAVTVEASLLMTLFTSAGGGGYAPVETFLRDLDTIRRGGVGMNASMPATVQPFVPVDLNVLVAEDDGNGGLDPVLGAVLDFTAVGGTLSASSAFTDAAGIATVRVTPGAGPGNVEVTVSASVDGEPIGTKVVTSQILGGGIILTQSRTHAQTTGLYPGEECQGSGDPDNENPFPGPASVSANMQQTCDWITYTTNQSANANVNSDTGVAPDGQSALMTFVSTGNMSASVIGETGDTEVTARGTFGAWFDVVGGPMDYEIRVNSATNGNLISAFVAIQRTDQGGAIVVSWSGLDTPGGGLFTGTLPPGSYAFGCTYDMSATASAGVPANSSWSGSASLALGSSVQSASGR